MNCYGKQTFTKPESMTNLIPSIVTLACVDVSFASTLGPLITHLSDICGYYHLSRTPFRGFKCFHLFSHWKSGMESKWN